MPSEAAASLAVSLGEDGSTKLLTISSAEKDTPDDSGMATMVGRDMKLFDPRLCIVEEGVQEVVLRFIKRGPDAVDR